MLCDGVGVWLLVLDPQGIRESPLNIDSNITSWVETQTGSQLEQAFLFGLIAIGAVNIIQA